MNTNPLNQLHLDPSVRQRPRRGVALILLMVIAITGVSIYFAFFHQAPAASQAPASPTNAPSSLPARSGTNAAAAASNPDSVLTVSGYLINRERIEISPRFLGVVKWIGVKKGDPVTNSQVVVLLEDAEQKARLQEVQGREAAARVALAKAELDFQRITKLNLSQVESKQAEDDARLRVESTRAALMEVQGALALAQTYLDWTIIRSPITGVVLERLVDPAELVVPQSFGGGRGPSTALLAVANPKDLQVEIDLNEADLAKVSLNQLCQITPEAYPDKHYQGYVAEIAPEANRQKGTLQVKVQIGQPDAFLTPELSAKVEFLRGTNAPAINSGR